MVVELSEHRWCNPIGKAFKRLENGPKTASGTSTLCSRPAAPDKNDLSVPVAHPQVNIGQQRAQQLPIP